MGDDLRARLATDGPVLLDGGLATTLEAGGLELPGPLWSAHALLTAPRVVEAAHRAFAAAGAEVLLTASYQLSARGLELEGVAADRHDELFARSVRLARRAADGAAHRVRVAGSLGPYGAALADGSEYTGAYELPTAQLRDFHAPRVAALLAAGADAVAVETLPSGQEVAALAPLLAGCGLPAWVSVTVAGDGTRTPRGEPLREALGPACEVEEVVAVGVNCCPSELVVPALEELRAAGGDRHLLAKPNAGARWDPARLRWRREAEPPDPAAWVAAGASLVGGCCGTTPEDLAGLARRLAAGRGR